MATATSIDPPDSTSAGTDAEKYARIVKIRIRNMVDFKRIQDTKVVVPPRTITNPSPLKKAGSNRHPGQTHTRTEIDGAMNHELANARLVMHDLADHVFGHIVSTELAGEIFQKFVQDRVVQVFETGSSNFKVPLHSKSDDAQSAVQQAFEHADRYDCIQADTQSDTGEPEGLSTNTNAKGKQKAKTYSFSWTKFPTEPLLEDKLVSFLNDITDRAFAFAKSKLAVANQKLHHRFTAPEDKHHAVPLSYEPDGEDMRPDFLLLPIEAFSDDLKTVDPKYVNFTAARLVGESKNKDVAAGIEQMQRYARGLKRAQPWVYYVLGMTVTRDRAVFMRGEGSGMERIDLMLTDGRGCIEFIRILLGLALADQVDLGHNPDVVLGWREQACKALNVSRRSNASSAKAASRQPHGNDQVVSFPDPLTRVRMSETQNASRPQSDPVTLHGNPTPSSSTKRDHSEIEDDGDEGKRSKKRKTGESTVKYVDRFVFYPDVVYGHKCLGTLFTASSIRGRGTTVFSVVRKEKRVALRMAWQDVTRMAEQDSVMERLKDQGSQLHPNVIVPLMTETVEKGGKICTTLGGIRGFLDGQIEELGVENRVLTISASDLKRPVKYFWGMHDFVRGLRGALLGHEYLTKIGILHRDISENNIVLGLRPGDERGYLIDLDLAILQNADEATLPQARAQPVIPRPRLSARFTQKSPILSELDGKKHMRALRTGTFPYISYNVLWGGKHTQFDDVESFLYVLLLFFFSYAGPLSPAELRKADEGGFVQSIGSGRSSHMRNWPKQYADWADGQAKQIAHEKHTAISTPCGVMEIIQSAEFVGCLENNWPKELHHPICVLIESSFGIFDQNTSRMAGKQPRTEVSHAEFVSVLDEWLDVCSHLEDKFSNCPFK